MTRTVVQCDFDGTVTYKDVSFLLLDEFAGPQWREYWEQYQDGRITVGRFNELAFGMVKASRQELLDYIVALDEQISALGVAGRDGGIAPQQSIGNLPMISTAFFPIQSSVGIG